MLFVTVINIETSMKHIEGDHITSISIPCDTCGKAFKSRDTLTGHKSRKHRKNQWTWNQLYKINMCTICS